MCYGCWAEEGRPTKMTPAVIEIAPLLREADEFGAMHIAVSDWNLDDDNIEFCRDYETATPDEKSLCAKLLAMSYPERLSAMALAEGFIDEAGKERE
jgi:hypothetical protein